MGADEEQVKVDLVPILGSLESLADDVKEMERRGDQADAHYLKVPKECAGYFLKAAEEGIADLQSIKTDRVIREAFDLERVMKGYELVKSGAVELLPLEITWDEF